MKLQEFRGALDGFVPAPELEGRIAAALAVQPGRSARRRLPRAAAFALAAALALMCVTATAVAADPELRAAVLTFFHIGAAEQVPAPEGAASGRPEVSGGEIGGLVKAQYIQLDGSCRYTDDNLIYRTEFDPETGEVVPVEFWTVEDGRAVPVEPEINRSEIHAVHNGETFDVFFRWFRWNGRVHTLSVSRSMTWETDETEKSVYILGGHDAPEGKLLLELGTGSQTDYHTWYMLYDLETGEAEDFLLGTGAEELEGMWSAEWSDDLCRAVLTCGQMEDQRDYLLDVEAKTVTPLEELTGLDNVSAVFADDGTLLLFRFQEPETGPGPFTVTCWAYDLEAGTLGKTLDAVPQFSELDERPHGVLLMGNQIPYCVLVDEDGGTRIMDLTNRETVEIEHFTFDPAGDLIVSPGGTKLLYFVRDMDGKPRLKWKQLGVIDLERGTFLAFDREVPLEAEETVLAWLDDSRVVIRSRSLEDWEDQGIYLYEF